MAALFFAVTVQTAIAAEKQETPKAPTAGQTQTVQQMPAYSVVEVQETGGETFFRATGQVINGLFKAVAMPFQWLGIGLDYCTPKAATHRVIVPNVQPVMVTQPVIQQPVIQPAVVAPTPVSIAPAPVIVAPAPVVVAPAPVYYPGYYYPRYHRYWYGRYWY